MAVLAACAAPTFEGFETTEIEVGGSQLAVAVADTPGLRRQGLQGVAALPDGIDGVLFAYEAPQQGSFHMRNTSFPLDIWWFDEQGVLIGSTAMDPCPAEPCPSYISPVPISWALETPSATLDLAPGSVLSVPG